MSGVGRRRARRACQAQTRSGLSRDHRGRRVLPGADLLPGELCLLSRSHGGRPSLWSSQSRALRRDDCQGTGAQEVMSDPVTVYVPRDASALSLGAEEVADAISKEASARGVELRLVRNGSRGAFWLEPLGGVVTPKGRVAYGPVTPSDVPGLFAADFLNGGQHPLALGLTDQIPWFASQQR